MRTIRAAVLVHHNEPLELVHLKLPELAKGQVLVKIRYSGICHTQLGEWKGLRGPDRFLPHCLGHEGSGVVTALGEGVTKVKPGDHVILSWIKGSGMDGGPVQYQWGETTVNAGPITTFSEYAVISEDRVTLIPGTLSLLYAALIGCAIPTGYGAVVNVAQPRPGMSFGIFGCGGIGLSALIAAKLSGCVPIIAIDINDEKLAVAREQGATHTINPLYGPIPDVLLDITQGGLDIAIEATGVPEVMEMMLPLVKRQGGIAVLIGNARFGDTISIDPHEFNLGKQLRGTWGGDTIPDRDFPRIVRLISSGIINPSFFISRIYSLEEINLAMSDLAEGKVIRPIIDMDL